MELGLGGWNLGLEAKIGATWLDFELPGWNLSFEARYWALRLDLKLEGVDGEEGKISPMCESIGHRPLRGCCPKNPKRKE